MLFLSEISAHREKLEKICYVLEKSAFYHFNQRLMLKRAATFAKQGKLEIRYLEFNKDHMKRSNSEMAEYPTTRKALLYETKVLQKWNRNETGK